MPAKLLQMAPNCCMMMMMMMMMMRMRRTPFLVQIRLIDIFDFQSVMLASPVDLDHSIRMPTSWIMDSWMVELRGHAYPKAHRAQNHGNCWVVIFPHLWFPVGDRSPRTVGDLKKAVRSAEGGALAHPLFKTPCCRWWLDALWVGLKIDGTWENIMIPSGDQTWQWKSAASIRKMVLMGKSSINMGFSIAMFDYGGYWKWAGLVKDDKTRQNPQLPVEFLLVAMVNDEKWYAKLAWNILAKRASDWTRPYCTWLCIWGIVSG